LDTNDLVISGEDIFAHETGIMVIVAVASIMVFFRFRRIHIRIYVTLLS